MRRSVRLSALKKQPEEGKVDATAMDVEEKDDEVEKKEPERRRSARLSKGGTVKNMRNIF